MDKSVKCIELTAIPLLIYILMTLAALALSILISKTTGDQMIYLLMGTIFIFLFVAVRALYIKQSRNLYNMLTEIIESVIKR